MADEQRLTLTEWVGGNVRDWRASAGVRQDDIVSAARRWGLAWTRSAVADLEAGRRRLTAEELVLLPIVLNDSAGGAPSPTLEELVAGKGDVALTERATMSLRQVAKILRSDETLKLEAPPATTSADMDDLVRAGWREAKAQRSHHLALPLDDAEKQAGRRLGVPARRIRTASVALWGRTLSAERDARVTGDGSARSKQALRGHVTRQLMESLAAALAQGVGEEA